MAVLPLDIALIEQGKGAGLYEVVTTGFDPASSINPTRQTGFSTVATVIGNADGYDVSSVSHVRIFFDVLVDSAATILKLLVVPAAANPKQGDVPAFVGPDAEASFFRPFVPVVQDTAGPVEVGDGGLVFPNPNAPTGTKRFRGNVVIPIDAQIVRFEVETDSPTAGSEIAAAVQSLLLRGG